MLALNVLSINLICDTLASINDFKSFLTLSILKYLNPLSVDDKQYELICFASYIYLERQPVNCICDDYKNFEKSIFIEEIDKIRNETGYDIPLGAGYHVDQIAKQILDEKGMDYLSKYVKLHFKNK